MILVTPVRAGRAQLRKSSGSLAIFAAILRASSLLILFWPPPKPLDDLVCAALSVAEQLRQLRNIHSNAPRLILGEQLGGRSSARYPRNRHRRAFARCDRGRQNRRPIPRQSRAAVSGDRYLVRAFCSFSSLLVPRALAGCRRAAIPLYQLARMVVCIKKCNLIEIKFF
jgi:hypothetical protein